jgi:hypothetical protein
MSLLTRSADESGVRLHELRRHQVYRLERPRRRSLLARLRRSVRGRLAR